MGGCSARRAACCMAFVQLGSAGRASEGVRKVSCSSVGRRSHCVATACVHVPRSGCEWQWPACAEAEQDVTKLSGMCAGRNHEQLPVSSQVSKVLSLHNTDCGRLPCAGSADCGKHVLVCFCYGRSLKYAVTQLNEAVTVGLRMSILY